MDLRFRLLLGLLSGGLALALAAAVLVIVDERQQARRQQEQMRCVLAQVDRSEGQQLSHLATQAAQPQAGGRTPAFLALSAVLSALAAWWLIVRALAARFERLKTALAQSRSQERRMRRDALVLREVERRELARELHDEFGQSLAVMVSAAGYVERHAGAASAQVLGECARDIRMAASQMARQVRGHLRRLRPQELQGFEMRAALKELVDGHWLAAAGLRVEAHWPHALPALSPEARLALYRTVQEALTNVVRHARASTVVLAMEADREGLRVCIEDDGHGDAQAVLRSSRSGVRGMRERAEMARGRLDLAPSGLGGLRVTLWLPASGSVEDEQGDEDHGERAAAG